MATVEKVTDQPAGQGPWVFTCGLPACGFTSTGHPSKASAEERRAEHMAEHEEA